MSGTQIFTPCPICDNTGWVCEGHGNHPWSGVSKRHDACGDGPGMPCPAANCEHSMERPEWTEEIERLKAALEDIALGRVTSLPLIQALAKAAIQHEAGDAAVPQQQLSNRCTCSHANDSCSNCGTRDDR